MIATVESFFDDHFQKENERASEEQKSPSRTNSANKIEFNSLVVHRTSLEKAVVVQNRVLECTTSIGELESLSW